MFYALISLSDFSGLEPFARTLCAQGWKLLATEGTAKKLEEWSLPYDLVSSVTQMPPLFSGRVKTLNTKLAGSILYDRTNPDHVAEADLHKIPDIRIVACNFYDFQSRPSIETIDIGGPTCVRAAAKNFKSVSVITDPNDYIKVTKEIIAHNEPSLETRKYLAAKAFHYVAQYDFHIANFFADKETMRYGENPHQKAHFLPLQLKSPISYKDIHNHSETALSYNNLLDIHSALEFFKHLGPIQNSTCVILKHTNPCGAALRKSAVDAFAAAWQGDPLAAFGGVVAFNCLVEESIVEVLSATKRFVDVLIAPAFSSTALEFLKQRKKLKCVEIKAIANLSNKTTTTQSVKSFCDGLLVQETEYLQPKFECMTQTQASETHISDLALAWAIAKVSVSNAITIVKNNQLLGSGVGQQDRMRACEIAIQKAGTNIHGAVAASDGFFPFADGPAKLIAAGVSAICQPGGSIRDEESISLCNQNKVTMCFTHERGFRH